MFDFLSGLSNLQLILLFSAIGYLVYTYVLQDTSSSSSSFIDNILSVFKSFIVQAKTKVQETGLTSSSNKPTALELVQSWEDLREKVRTANLQDAGEQLDEVWNLLNPNLGDKNEIKV